MNWQSSVSSCRNQGSHPRRCCRWVAEGVAVQGSDIAEGEEVEDRDDIAEVAVDDTQEVAEAVEDDRQGVEVEAVAGDRRVTEDVHKAEVAVAGK